MGANGEPRRFCPKCGLPLVRHQVLEARLCLKCLGAFRDGRPVALKRVSPVLVSLRDATNFETRLSKLEGPYPPGTRCAVVGCTSSGPIQRAHVFRRSTHGQHPLYNHQDAVFPCCQYHHRLLHRLIDGFDYAAPARRNAFPPGYPGPLSLAFVAFVISRVRPSDRVKALRLGVLLSSRILDRVLPDGDAPLEVDLYYRWLYSAVGDVHGIRAFKGIVFDYDERGYIRPLLDGSPGTCRKYCVYPEVARALQAGPLVRVEERDLRSILAHRLEQRGVSRREIATTVRTSKNTTPGRSTISGWIKRGIRLVEQDSGDKKIVSRMKSRA